MEIVLSILLVLNVFLVGYGIWLLARSLERLSLKLHETSGKLDNLIEETRTLVRSLDETTVPLVSRTQTTVGNIDRFAVKLYSSLENADRLMNALERLANTLTLAPLATKAAQVTRGSVVSLITGVREGLKTLRHGKGEQNRGGENDELTEP